MTSLPRVKSALVALAFAASTGCSSVLAADATGRFAKPIQLPSLDKEELVAAQLDGDVYEASADGFHDLRLRDAAGEEVAYIVRKATRKGKRRERRWFTISHPLVRPQDDGSLEITFALDADDVPARPLGFRVMTPLKNFERRVAVAVAAEGDQWLPLVDDGLVFDYSRFMDVRQTELPLPRLGRGEPSARRYRLTIAEVTEEQQSQLVELTRTLQSDEETSRSERVVVNRQPFRIDRIDAWYDIDVADVIRDEQREYPIGELSQSRDGDTNATIATFDSRREPLTSVSIVTADQNFRRSATITAEARGHSTANHAEWLQDLGSGTIERLNFRDLKRENLAVSFPETRNRRYRVVVANGDSKPLTIAGAVARGPVYEIIFLARAGESYRLAYGGTMAPPSYDTAAIDASIAAGYEPIAAALGLATPMEAPASPPQPLLAAALNDSRVLGGIITLLVIILGVGLYRATRRLEDLPDDDVPAA